MQVELYEEQLHSDADAYVFQSCPFCIFLAIWKHWAWSYKLVACFAEKVLLLAPYAYEETVLASTAWMSAVPALKLMCSNPDDALNDTSSFFIVTFTVLKSKMQLKPVTGFSVTEYYRPFKNKSC